MGKFLTFEKMITPIFIQIIFWIHLMVAIVSGFGFIVYGFIGDNVQIIYTLIGIGVILIGPIVSRLFCEILIVNFKIQQALVDMKYTLSEVKVIPSEESVAKENFTSMQTTQHGSRTVEESIIEEEPVKLEGKKLAEDPINEENIEGDHPIEHVKEDAILQKDPKSKSIRDTEMEGNEAETEDIKVTGKQQIEGES